MRKLAMERANRASIKIQALIRRFLTRCKFHKSYKRLVRERAQRIKIKRDKAATKIQSIFRLVLAKKTVAARKQQHQEEKRTEELLEQLEVDSKYVLLLY
jgi:polyhydroxyalkanoate synthesis regulator phasin